MTHSFDLVKSFGFNNSTYLLSACVPFAVAYLYATPQGSYHFAVNDGETEAYGFKSFAQGYLVNAKPGLVPRSKRDSQLYSFCLPVAVPAVALLKASDSKGNL